MSRVSGSVSTRVETVMTQPVARLGGGLPALGLRHQLAPEGADAAGRRRVDVIVRYRLAVAIGAEAGMEIDDEDVAGGPSGTGR